MNCSVCDIPMCYNEANWIWHCKNNNYPIKHYCTNFSSAKPPIGSKFAIPGKYNFLTIEEYSIAPYAFRSTFFSKNHEIIKVIHTPEVLPDFKCVEDILNFLILC